MRLIVKTVAYLALLLVLLFVWYLAGQAFPVMTDNPYSSISLLAAFVGAGLPVNLLVTRPMERRWQRAARRVDIPHDIDREVLRGYHLRHPPGGRR